MITDFGTARVDNATMTEGTIGTLLFTAPDVIETGIHRKSSDVFALGIIMWMLFTKKTEALDLYPDIGSHRIAEEVRKGKRPQELIGCPSWYSTIMKR